MNKLLMISALSIFTVGTGVAAFYTYTGKGLNCPLIQKRTIRRHSVGHRRLPGGYRHGK